MLLVAWREEDSRFCWELVVRMTHTADGGLDAGSRQPMDLSMATQMGGDSSRGLSMTARRTRGAAREDRDQHVDGVGTATQRLSVEGLGRRVAPAGG